MTKRLRRGCAAAALAGSLVMRAVPPAMASMSIVVQDDPVVLVTGFNVYAPDIARIGGYAMLYFGGWLAQSDMPHDAVYRCVLSPVSGRWTGCGTPIRVMDIGRLSEPANHVNDPSLGPQAPDGTRPYAVTVCTGTCHGIATGEIWIGRVRPDGDLDPPHPLVRGNADEPVFATLPGEVEPVVLFTRRADTPVIYAQAVDWSTLTPEGAPRVVFRDRAGDAISSPSYASFGGVAVLAWNRFEPGPGGVGLGRISVAYATSPGNRADWSAPEPLRSPEPGYCALITPALTRDPDGNPTLVTGRIATQPDGSCRLTGWSKAIVAYRLSVRSDAARP